MHAYHWKVFGVGMAVGGIWRQEQPAVNDLRSNTWQTARFIIRAEGKQKIKQLVVSDMAFASFAIRT